MDLIEAGCDEAGRGCLAGPVVAAAVVLGDSFDGQLLDDSKKLSPIQRSNLRQKIELEALSWAVAFVDNNEIDKINILNASFLAMHNAIKALTIMPGLLLIDGNRFNRYSAINHKCIIKGDGKFMAIAAASILAKTHRDEYMKNLSNQYTLYGWETNMGYPTVTHRNAIKKHGITSYHRKSFQLLKRQHTLFK